MKGGMLRLMGKVMVNFIESRESVFIAVLIKK